MSKNKGTHGRGKVAVEEPDEFVQTVSSLSDTLAPHIKKIVIGVALFIALLCAWQTMKWMHNKKAMAATTAYLSALKVVQAPVVEAEDTPSPTADSATLSFASTQARSKASVEALNGLDEHSDIALVRLSVVKKAKVALQDGRFDDAIAGYTQFASSDAPEILRLVALESRGYSLEAKALSQQDATARQTGLQAALTAFADLQPNEGGQMRDYSLYHQGRMLVALGKNDEGIAMYQKLMLELPETPLSYFVKERLTALGADLPEVVNSDDLAK